MKHDIDVLCIGDLDVDMFISVPALPSYDQKVAGRSHGQMPGGMSANCAVAAARLGLTSRLIAAAGSDAAGAFALSEIAREGVDVGYVAQRAGVDTFMCVILLSPSGEKSLIRLETDAYLPRPQDLNPDAFEGVRHMHVTFGDPALAFSAFAMARTRGISVSLDLEPPDIARNPGRLAELLPMIDTLFLNQEAYDAAGSVLGAPISPSMLRRNGEIIVTLGKDGCRRIGAEGSIDMPGFPVRPVDTTGAGDCFAAAYLAAAFTGKMARERLEFANAAAALATLQCGAQTAMPRREGVVSFIAERRAAQAAAGAVVNGAFHA
ncbi:MAG: PfkB family carbohydrate kinase [Parvibaculaceae bacterium]